MAILSDMDTVLPCWVKALGGEGVVIPSKPRSRTDGTFDNPEITAMSDIAEILQQLPDDEARLRVMRWAFGRFSAEFTQPVPTPLKPATPPAPCPISASSEPPATVKTAGETAVDASDFGKQISELADLFPKRVTEEDEDSTGDLWPA